MEVVTYLTFSAPSRLNYVILRPAIIYGIADKSGLSKCISLLPVLVYIFVCPPCSSPVSDSGLLPAARREDEVVVD